LRSGGLAFALGVAIAIVSAGAYWYFDTPTRFKVAIPGHREPESRALAAFARALTEQDKDIQLDIVPVRDVEDGAMRLQKREVDLALVRPDIFLPGNGLTVAIMSEPSVLILAPSENISDLAQKRIGLVTEQGADLALVSTVLGLYEIRIPPESLRSLPASAVAEALSNKEVDAIAIVAAPGRAVSNLITAIQKAAEPDLTMLELAGSTSLTTLSPAFNETTIPAGSLGSHPRLPAEDTKTIATSYRLMARSDLDRGPVSELTEYLFQMRSRIAKTEPAINLMKAPEDETAMSAALPNHPGAIDYLTREQETFMDRWGDWVWLGLFLGGGVSSAAAWSVQVLARGRRERVTAVLDRLLVILREARTAPDRSALDDLSLEVDALVMETIGHTQSGATDSMTMSALILAIDASRAALADRRTLLAHADPRPGS
jgi:NMT1-like family